MTTSTPTPIIRTTNANISADFCKSLDQTLYHTEPQPDNPFYNIRLENAAFVRSELLEYIHQHNPALCVRAQMGTVEVPATTSPALATKGLYYLYCVAAYQCQ